MDSYERGTSEPFFDVSSDDPNNLGFCLKFELSDLESGGTIEYYLCNKIKAPNWRLYPHLTRKARKATDHGRRTTTLTCIL